jgi:hypothetical protein
MSVILEVIPACMKGVEVAGQKIKHIVIAAIAIAA